MNEHKLLRMIEEAGFDFTPDIMNKLQKFQNLIWIEREACLQAVGDLIRKHRDEEDGELEGYPDIFDAVEAIRARGVNE